MRCLLVLLPCLFVAVFGKGEVCSQDAPCSQPNECCQRIRKFIILGRRQVGSNYDSEFYPANGTCEPFKQVGDACNKYDTFNGYCGCGENLTCTMKAVMKDETGIEHGIVKRTIRPPPKGHYWAITCQPDP